MLPLVCDQEGLHELSEDAHSAPERPPTCCSRVRASNRDVFVVAEVEEEILCMCTPREAAAEATEETEGVHWKREKRERSSKHRRR